MVEPNVGFTTPYPILTINTNTLEIVLLIVLTRTPTIIEATQFFPELLYPK